MHAADIPFEDASGKRFDFHSLRHEQGSLLAASGCSPKVAQELMRHSDINLTMNYYTHTFKGQKPDAVESLPEIKLTNTGGKSAKQA